MNYDHTLKLMYNRAEDWFEHRESWMDFSDLMDSWEKELKKVYQLGYAASESDRESKIEANKYTSVVHEKEGEWL